MAKKQTELPGIENPKTIPEIEELNDKYQKIKDARCKISPKENSAKAELMDAMKKHEGKLARNEEGAAIYVHEDSGKIIVLEHGVDTLSFKNYRAPEGAE